ncbi:MAG: leucine-rich repeat domain-containing protein [Alphaproteobacteria bacterium]|nr:leucine-rich repeat domain-containing protein [Alphaproteobacteria bacterium]
MIQRICITIFMLVFALNLNAISRGEKEKITKEFLKDIKDINSMAHDDLLSRLAHHNQLSYNHSNEDSKDYLRSRFDQLAIFTWLTLIDLSGFDLENVPDFVSSMKELRILNISNNKIVSLPDDLSQLNNIEELNLSNNLFTDVPESLKNFTTLSLLDLSKNRISAIPSWLVQNKSIKKLIFSDNFIRSIPKEFKNWLSSGGDIVLSNDTFQKMGEGENIGLDDLQFLKRKQKEKKYFSANFNNKSLKSAVYKKNEKKYPHIDLDNLSEIRPKDLPEADLDGNEMISLFNKLSTSLNLESDDRPLYLDFYDITGFWIDDIDPITNKKCFQQVVFPLAKGFLKTIWNMPLSKGETASFILDENKLLLKNILAYILTKLNVKEDKGLIFLFMQHLVQAVINPLNSIEIIQPTLSELQKSDLHLIEDVKDRLLQFIVYKKELCFDSTLLNVDEKYQIPIRSYYKTSLNDDLGLYCQNIPTQIRIPIPTNDPFEGNPWSVLDSFLMKFTPHYLIECIIENTKKAIAENSFFTIEELAQFLKENDAMDDSNINYWEPYFTEDPFIDDNQSTLKEEGAQKALELLGIINVE